MRLLLSRLLLRFCALLPLPLNHKLGALLGRGLFHFSHALRSTTEINLRLCFPDLSPAAHRELAQASMIEMGKTITETGPLWLWEKRNLLTEVRQVNGEQHLHDAVARGNGVLLALPHLGAWELIGLYCSANHPMTSLYRPPRMEGLDDTMRSARERLGATLVPTTTQGVRALYRALANGEVVAILPDQDPRDGGEFAPFFGNPAYTMTLLARLAKKSHAPILFSYAERLPHGKGYHLHFIPANWKADQYDISHNIQYINAAIERCIVDCPEQYQWSYKRFRTRPEGETSLYG